MIQVAHGAWASAALARVYKVVAQFAEGAGLVQHPTFCALLERTDSLLSERLPKLASLGDTAREATDSAHGEAGRLRRDRADAHPPRMHPTFAGRA